MCGICGIHGARSGGDARAAVHRMVDAQRHRGPDDAGTVVRDGTVLGHDRLSIIDLSPCGHQPMSNEDGTVWVVFNGEIYNHLELREALRRAGHRFASSSDTEVLVHGFEEWGLERLLHRLRGMFAFALLDERGRDAGGRGTLHLARDRFGIKPLYYAPLPDGGIAFASEVRALADSGIVAREEEPRAWLGFLLFGSVPSPWTTLRGTFALPPGCSLTSDAAGRRTARWYSLEALYTNGVASTNGRNSPRNGAADVQDLRRELRSVLEEAVRLHLLSDAPLGVFLSGGIDSSALVALAAMHEQRLRTVAITFEERSFSEEPYQRIVAERYGTEHVSVPVTSATFRDALPRFFAAMDQPTVDGINTYLVAQAARQAGLKAVLAGIGGDEVFAGYDTLRRAPALWRVHALSKPLRRAALGISRLRPGLRKLAFLERGGTLPFYLAQRGLYTPREAAALLGGDEAEAWRLIESLELPATPHHAVLVQQLLETHHYLTDQLLRDGDVFGMAHSLEIRVPFLDHVLVETALRAPLHARFDETWPKPLLSRTLADLLPREIIFRPKQGFQFPISPWLRQWGDEVPLPPGADRRVADRVWAEFQRGHVHWSRPWSMMVLARRTG